MERDGASHLTCQEGLVFKTQRLFCHSNIGSRVMSNNKKKSLATPTHRTSHLPGMYECLQVRLVSGKTVHALYQEFFVP